MQNQQPFDHGLSQEQFQQLLNRFQILEPGQSNIQSSNYTRKNPSGQEITYSRKITLKKITKNDGQMAIEDFVIDSMGQQNFSCKKVIQLGDQLNHGQQVRNGCECELM